MSNVQSSRYSERPSISRVVRDARTLPQTSARSVWCVYCGGFLSPVWAVCLVIHDHWLVQAACEGL